MRTRIVILLTCVSIVFAALPARADSEATLGEVTLRWTMIVQASDTFSKDWRTDWAEDYEWTTEVASDQLTLTYEGRRTWQVLRDGAGHLELDQGQGEYRVSGSGGGNQQIEHWEGPRSSYCAQGGSGGYWVPSSSLSTSSWAYQADAGEGGRVYVSLNRQDDEIAYSVNWDWEQEITLDGTVADSSRGCGSSSSSEACGTSTMYWTCPGAGGAQTYAELYVLGLATQRGQEALQGKVRPEDWGFSVTGRATYSPEPQAESDTGDEYRSQRTLQGSGVLEYTLTYEREPTDLEAVITFPGEGEYEQWQPRAGRDEDTVGSQLRVEAELRYKDRPEETPLEKATFRFRLVDTSREPGVCLNAPPKDQAQDTYDLKIDQEVNPDLDVGEDGQEASTADTTTGAGVTISSYDWGAYGRLQVTATTEDGRLLIAHLDGQPEKEHASIPLDDNDNHIADAWEANEGVLDQGYPANWDAALLPRGQESDGDGIALYERYRGFEFGSGAAVYHERLNALTKHILVYDPDGIVLSTIVDPRGAASSLPAVSQCRVRFVDDQHWTGSGLAGDKKRIVNFNTSGFGHALDQHALDIRLDASESPINPPDWREHYEAATGRKYTEVVGTDIRGITYPDLSVDSGTISPKDFMRIVIFANNIAHTTRDTVRHHTWGLPEYVAASAGDLEPEVDRYINEHMDEFGEAYQKQLARVISHEAGHGLGIEHHKPTTMGDRACVMRYQAHCPRDPNDRFALGCNSPWPHTFCQDGPGCWAQVQIADR